MKICERELREVETEGCALAEEEENNIFQSSYRSSTGCKTSKVYGHGYMAKRPTTADRLHAQIDETQRQNVELHDEVRNLRDQLANEHAERDRIIEQSRLQQQEEAHNARLPLREELREELK